MSTPWTESVLLRLVTSSDLPVFFAQQREPRAAHLAAFVSRDPDDELAFQAHWQRILGNPEILIRTIVHADAIAGYVSSFPMEADAEITYWLGQDHWGRGIATQALRVFLSLEKRRPLRARAACDNTGSIRVLEKCGFKLVGTNRDYAPARKQEIEEALFILS